MAWTDWVPIVSNVKGAINGNARQAMLGPTSQILPDPGKGYDTAAKGAGQAYQANKDFSQQQWDRQQEGLGQALGMYGPAQGYWDRNYGTQGPGALENYWQQNGSSFNAPTQTSSALGDFRQYMGDMSATSIGQSQAQRMMSSNGNDVYAKYGDSLAGPGQASGAYSRNSGTYNTPGAMEMYAGAAQQNLGSPGAMEQWYQQNQGQYANQNRSAGAYGQAQQQLSGPGQSESYKTDTSFANPLSGTMGKYSAARGGTSTDAMQGEIGGYFRNADDMSKYAASQNQALSGPGQYENFVSSTLNGDNPYLQRIRDKGMADINQQMAARGHFNSGGALAALGNYAAAQNSQEFQDKENLAQQAQQMQLARIAQGTSTMGASGASKLAQGQGLQGLANQIDTQHNNFERLSFDEANADAQNQLAAQKLNLGAAGQADAAALARLQGLSGMAGAADAGGLAALQAASGAAGAAQGANQSRTTSLADILNQAQTAGLNRANSSVNAGNTADQSDMARLAQMFGMAQGTDQGNLARAAQTFNMGQGVDQSTMARYGMLGQLSGQQDQASLARLLGGGQVAGAAQDAQQQRMQQAFASLFGLNNAMAGQVGGFYGNGGQLSGQAMSDALNALMAQYGLQGQGQTARAKEPYDIANVGINAAKIPK